MQENVFHFNTSSNLDSSDGYMQPALCIMPHLLAAFNTPFAALSAY